MQDPSVDEDSEMQPIGWSQPKHLRSGVDLGGNGKTFGLIGLVSDLHSSSPKRMPLSQRSKSHERVTPDGTWRAITRSQVKQPTTRVEERPLLEGTSARYLIR
jgi:hypothetical protein